MLIEFTQTTVTVDWREFVVIVVLVFMLLGVGLAYLCGRRRVLQMGMRTPERQSSLWVRLKEAFGLVDASATATFVFGLIASVAFALFLLALIAALAMLGSFLVEAVRPILATKSNVGLPAAPGGGTQSLGFGALVVALLSGPFLIWRSVVAQKTLNVQDEALFNDKVQAASQQLYSRRQVSTRVGRGEAAKVLDQWEDNNLAQSVAIERLESLGVERPEEAARIVRVLSTYARKVSRQAPRPEAPADIGKMSIEAVREWIAELPVAREEVQQAIRSAARLNSIVLQWENNRDLEVFDLRGAILPRVDLQGLDLRWARLDQAFLCGSTLRRAQLAQASFRGAEMIQSSLVMAKLGEAAFFQNADLAWADFSGATGVKTRFNGAKLHRTSFHGGVFQGADFTFAECHKTQMQEAKLNDACLWVNNPRELLLSGAVLKGAILESQELGADALSKSQRAELRKPTVSFPPER